MGDLHAVKVGDELAVCDQAPLRVLPVVRVNARRIDLSDGSRWSRSTGQIWGSGKESYYNGLTVRLATAGDVTASLRRRSISRLSRLTREIWEKLDADELRTVNAIVSRAQKREQKDKP